MSFRSIGEIAARMARKIVSDGDYCFEKTGDLPKMKAAPEGVGRTRESLTATPEQEA